MKPFAFSTVEDHFKHKPMNRSSKIGRFHNLLTRCLFVISLIGLPVQFSHSGSIATDGDIVGDGVSLGAVKTLICDHLVASSVPLPPMCLLEAGERFVFVTSTGSTSGGNFLQWAEDLTGNTFTDGLLAGDAVCQYHADNATPPLPGRYKAWLSTSSVDAKDRVGDHTWVRTDGSQVTESLSGLLDCSSGVCLDISIAITEQNEEALTSFVWTGTTPEGTGEVAATCADWTSVSGGIGVSGISLDVEVTWTSHSTSVCSFGDPVYCFGD